MASSASIDVKIEELKTFVEHTHGVQYRYEAVRRGDRWTGVPCDLVKQTSFYLL